MTDLQIQYDHQPQGHSSAPNDARSSSAVSWLVRLFPRYIKDERTAGYVLAALCVLIILIAIFAIPRSGNQLPREDPHSKAGDRR